MVDGAITHAEPLDYDWIVIGSGFGGSVCGLRLTEKGYRVLMLEQGRAISPADMPRSTWDLRRWLWLPALGCRGFFRMRFFRHLTVFEGVAVGGGSIAYAAAHPMPRAAFYRSGSWAKLHENWELELAAHFETARRMLGVTRNPILGSADRTLRALAEQHGRAAAFVPADVAIHFGAPGVPRPDPYFEGRGPDRTGCTACGGCLLGCRVGAKNSLDKNYLPLAQRLGMLLRSESEVIAIRPLPRGGYRIEARIGRSLRRRRVSFTARRVVLAGGVLGSVALLLAMRQDPEGLPRLSPCVGAGVRTNSEAFLPIIAENEGHELDRGVAIGSIWQASDVASVEPERFGAAQPGLLGAMLVPYVSGSRVIVRLWRLLATLLAHPISVGRALFRRRLGRRMCQLLYMQAIEGTLLLKRAWHGGLISAPSEGERLSARIPAALDIAQRYAAAIGGRVFSTLREVVLDIPTTGHPLGGACMGANPGEGVIDRDHRVFGYEGLYVVDGSSVSANPGVNPSLTIAALAERAMAQIPHAPGEGQ
jgi:cholesterol oxidase